MTAGRCPNDGSVWIHLHEVVRLMIFAAEHDGVSGALNVSSPEPVGNAKFARTLAKVLHRPALFPAAQFALRMIPGEIVDFLFASELVMQEPTQAAGFSYDFPLLEGALAAVLRR